MKRQPKRIQRKRTKGWRMPEGAVHVARPTMYGNPYLASAWGQARSVGMYRALLRNPRADGCRHESQARWILRHLADLRGKDLICWCPLDAPCHADVLLELANKEKP